MTLTLEQWKGILDAVIPNKGDIFEQIKGKLQEQDEDTYQNWKQKGFDVDHLFDVPCMGEKKRFALLHIAATSSNQGVMKALLDKGANINVKDKNGKTPLYNATVCNRLDNVKYLIKQADVNAKDEDGKTSLHKAALLNHLEIVKVLLQNGADVNAKDKNNTSFHIAARSGHVGVAQALIKAGADVSVTKYNRQTRLHLADVNARNKNSYYILLHYAVENGHSEIVKALLQSGADINAKDRNGRTLLHYATENGHTEIVTTLLQSGAIIDARDNIGNTPLYCAIHNSRLNIRKKESVIKYIVLFDSNGIKPDFINANAELSKFWYDCSGEIEKLQGNICGSTMYRLLQETDANELAGLIRKNDKQKKLEEFNYENEFPMYGSNLKRQFKIGKQRLDALNIGEIISMHFYREVGPFNREIVEYLSNKDIQNLREAAIQAMDEEKDDQLNFSSSMNSISDNQPNPTSSHLSISKGDEKLSETIPKNQDNFTNTGSNKNPSIEQLQENNATFSVRAIAGILLGTASAVYSGILGVVASAQLIKDKGADSNLKDHSNEHEITQEEVLEDGALGNNENIISHDNVKTNNIKADNVQLNTLGNKSTSTVSSQLQTSLQEYVADEYKQDEQLNLSSSMDSISSNQSNLTSSQSSDHIDNEECSVTIPESQSNFENIDSNSYSSEEQPLLKVSASNNKQGVESEVLLSESESEDDKSDTAVILAGTKQKKQASIQSAEQASSMIKESIQPKPVTNEQDLTTAELFSTNLSLGDNNLQIAVQSDKNQQMNAEKACSNNTLEIPEQILVSSNEKELIASTDYSRRDAVTKTENAGDLHIATLDTQQATLHVSAKIFNKFRKKNAAGLSVEFIADNISEIAQKFLNYGISQAVIFLSRNNSITLNFDDITNFPTIKKPALGQESKDHVIQESFTQVLQPESLVSIRNDNIQFVGKITPVIKVNTDRYTSHAAEIGDKEGVKALIKIEEDIDARDKYVRTPLHYAASTGNTTLHNNVQAKSVQLNNLGNKSTSTISGQLQILTQEHTISSDNEYEKDYQLKLSSSMNSISDNKSNPTLSQSSNPKGDEERSEIILKNQSSFGNSGSNSAPYFSEDRSLLKVSASDSKQGMQSDSQNTKMYVVAISAFAMSGIVSGIAIAVYSGMLAIGIAVGVCCLITAAVMYYCNSPSNLLKDSNTEVAMNQGQEL